MAKDAKGHGSDARGGDAATRTQSGLQMFGRKPTAAEQATNSQAVKNFSALAAAHQSGVAAAIEPAPDRLVGYVGKGGTLTDWHGNQIGTVSAKSSWATPKSYVGSRMYSYEAQHKGATYHGRGFGEGMALSLKRKK